MSERITPRRVMLALTDINNLEAWVDLANLMTDHVADISIQGMTTIPEGVSLSEGARQTRQWREAFAELTRTNDLSSETMQIRVDYHPLARILNDIATHPPELLIVQWQGPTALTGGVTTDEILQATPCDVALVHGEFWVNGSKPVLLSLRGGPNLSLGVDVAKAFAKDTTITLFHAADNTSLNISELSKLMQNTPSINRTVTVVGEISDGILREAESHGMIILGATLPQTDLAMSTSGSVVHRIADKTNVPIVLIRAWHPEEIKFHPPRFFIHSEEDLSTRVDRWFAENTVHSHEFADLKNLMAMKEKTGETISVGLPALNEEETVGNVIDVLKTALMDEVPLVDEFVLIDSNSEDRTVEIAEERGVPVYKHPEILPEVGSYRGKGEALWKSLHVLKGDIIAWVDTDITNIHPRFIYGIVGPLLRRPSIQYVKGFYQRPIKVDGQLQAYGGGRVTELVARPYFNLFYPELSGIIQPLSGEYAGRRSALESVPFFSGYGVETGLLIDLHEQYGLNAIAQTDLEVRVHHNQPLQNLSKMAFAIIQVFTGRMEATYGLQLLDHANQSMKLIHVSPERFALDLVEIGDYERPPMMKIPAYQQRHIKEIADE